MEAAMQEAWNRLEITSKPTQTNWRKIARSNQIEPDGDWMVWLLLAGRGFGKTRTIVEWANEQANNLPGSRGMIVGPTAGDVRDVLVEGQSGFKSVIPNLNYEPSKRRLTWPNGTVASLFSADEPDRLRGPQGHWAICDEMAAWRRMQAWDMLKLALRLGKKPRCAIATTPRPLPEIKQLIADPMTHITRGSTYENKDNLSPEFFRQVVERYEGTRLGRQEIYAEILDDAQGALWHRSLIDELRVSRMPELQRIVVAIDPAIKTSGAECGICAGGRGIDGQGYLLEDASLKASPSGWANQAVALYNRLRANLLVAEDNQGGEMVSLTIATIPGAPKVELIHATTGKQARAEPIAAMYEQKKIHHVGSFPQLEDELCNWEPNSGMPSPNRLDAMVYVFSKLMLQPEAKVEVMRMGG
jgi:phage terminase large subunit-like protein